MLEDQNQDQPQQFFSNNMPYTVLKSDGVILKAGKPTICPVTPRIPVESTFGKVEIRNFTCTLACPKCNIMTVADNEKMENGNTFLQISCMGTTHEYPFTWAEEEKTNNLKPVV